MAQPDNDAAMCIDKDDQLSIFTRPKIQNDSKSKMTQNQKWPKIENDPKIKITQNQKWPNIKNDPKSKMTKIKNDPK